MSGGQSLSHVLGIRADLADERHERGRIPVDLGLTDIRRVHAAILTTGTKPAMESTDSAPLEAARTWGEAGLDRLA
jgi:hypothetical protein